MVCPDFAVALGLIFVLGNVSSTSSYIAKFPLGGGKTDLDIVFRDAVWAALIVIWHDTDHWLVANQLVELWLHLLLDLDGAGARAVEINLSTVPKYT